jgi:predicted NAD/FAD-binding protein
MKIAIIGSGISGLTAAHILNRRHVVDVFEANNYVGGHTNTIEVSESDRMIPVDTGFIVFNEYNYPNLCRLFGELGVDSRESDMSFSVRSRASGLEYNGSNLNKLFSQRRNLLNLKFFKMLRDMLRFHDEAPGFLANNLNDYITVAEFVRDNNYSKYFIDYYLIPLGASLWSCPAEKFSQFPMRFVLEFLDNHRMLQVENRPQWRTVTGGSNQYVKKLIKPFSDQIHLNMPVAKVKRRGGRVNVIFSNGSEEVYDEVIMAAHADQSLKLVEDMDEEEKSILEYFPYQDNEAILHTDTSVLPVNQNAWASWNYLIPSGAGKHVTVTYNMNILQGIESKQTYCVSLNQAELIDPGKIIKRIRYHHPVFRPGRDSAQDQHKKLIKRRGISYCGAYWGYGFHEDGVRSGLSVADAFDMELAA